MPLKVSRRCLRNNRSTRVEESDEEPDYYLDTTYLDETTESAWRMDVMVNSNKVQFKVDTGAEVTAVSESAWKTLSNVPPLSPTKKLLGGPDRKLLSVLGEAKVSLSCGQKSSMQTVCVIKN